MPRLMPQGQVDGVSLNANFQFVPIELAATCRGLVERYHAMNGYSCLPDILWQSNARDFIKHHRDLNPIFRRACKRRGAKQANDALLFIAMVIVSLEVLARDLAGWGWRFPDAKRAAAGQLGDRLLTRPIRLLETYLHPRDDEAAIVLLQSPTANAVDQYSSRGT